MADLISRAAAIDAIVSATAFPDAEYIKNLCRNPANSEDWLGGVCDAINAVEEVNAVPVVHGRWVHLDPRECATISGKCSRCGWEAHYYEDDVADMPYCPNCGAKMDGEADG